MNSTLIINLFSATKRKNKKDFYLSDYAKTHFSPFIDTQYSNKPLDLFALPMKSKSDNSTAFLKKPDSLPPIPVFLKKIIFHTAIENIPMLKEQKILKFNKDNFAYVLSFFQNSLDKTQHRAFFENLYLPSSLAEKYFPLLIYFLSSIKNVYFYCFLPYFLFRKDNRSHYLTFFFSQHHNKLKKKGLEFEPHFLPIIFSNTVYLKLFSFNEIFSFSKNIEITSLFFSIFTLDNYFWLNPAKTEFHILEKFYSEWQTMSVQLKRKISTAYFNKRQSLFISAKALPFIFTYFDLLFIDYFEQDFFATHFPEMVQEKCYDPTFPFYFFTFHSFLSSEFQQLNSTDKQQWLFNLIQEKNLAKAALPYIEIFILKRSCLPLFIRSFKNSSISTIFSKPNLGKQELFLKKIYFTPDLDLQSIKKSLSITVARSGNPPFLFYANFSHFLNHVDKETEVVLNYYHHLKNLLSNPVKFENDFQHFIDLIKKLSSSHSPFRSLAEVPKQWTDEFLTYFDLNSDADIAHSVEEISTQLFSKLSLLYKASLCDRFTTKKSYKTVNSISHYLKIFS